VDAAAEAFVPLCIYNNTGGGHDREVLQAFEERAWNNPVVRIITPDRRDLVPRIGRDWTVRAMATAMVAALGAAKREVPAYLKLLAAAETAKRRGLDTAIFGMG
jgi:hypothetical protein